MSPALPAALAGLPIIGAMQPIDGKAALSIAAPVYRLPDGRILIGFHFLDGTVVDGELLDDDDEWRALIGCEDACELPEAVAPGVPVSVWILRPHGPVGWQALAATLIKRRSAAVLCLHVGGADVILVRKDAEEAIKADLMSEADGRAAEAMAQGDMAAALSWADLAMLAEPWPTPERHGRLIGLLRAAGARVRAEGWLAMVRNSRGADFAAAVDRIARDVDPSHD